MITTCKIIALLLLVGCGSIDFVANIDLNIRVNAFCDGSNNNNLCEKYTQGNSNTWM